MTKPLCIYHGNCADGFTAAWAVLVKHLNREFPAFVFTEGASYSPPEDDDDYLNPWYGRGGSASTALMLATTRRAQMLASASLCVEAECVALAKRLAELAIGSTPANGDTSDAKAGQ